MAPRITQCTAVGRTELRDHARLPIAYEVSAVFDVELIEAVPGGFRLRERSQVPAYVKDYDSQTDGGPEDWGERFDLRNWGIFRALDGDQPVGGAVAADGW